MNYVPLNRNVMKAHKPGTINVLWSPDFCFLSIAVWLKAADGTGKQSASMPPVFLTHPSGMCVPEFRGNTKETERPATMASFMVPALCVMKVRLRKYLSGVWVEKGSNRK